MQSRSPAGGWHPGHVTYILEQHRYAVQTAAGALAAAFLVQRPSGRQRFGIKRDDRVEFGALIVICCDAVEIELGQPFGSERSCVEGTIQVGDRRL